MHNATRIQKLIPLLLSLCISTGPLYAKQSSGEPDQRSILLHVREIVASRDQDELESWFQKIGEDPKTPAPVQKLYRKVLQGDIDHFPAKERILAIIDSNIAQLDNKGELRVNGAGSALIVAVLGSLIGAGNSYESSAMAGACYAVAVILLLVPGF